MEVNVIRNLTTPNFYSIHQQLHCKRTQLSSVLLLTYQLLTYWTVIRASVFERLQSFILLRFAHADHAERLALGAVPAHETELH